MALFGSNWKDEPTSEEKYEEITGQKFYGDKDELDRQIDKDLMNPYTSKTDRASLLDLQSILRQNGQD